MCSTCALSILLFFISYPADVVSEVIISSETKCEMSGTASQPPTMTSRCDGEVYRAQSIKSSIVRNDVYFKLSLAKYHSLILSLWTPKKRRILCRQVYENSEQHRQSLFRRIIIGERSYNHGINVLRGRKGSYVMLSTLFHHARSPICNAGRAFCRESVSVLGCNSVYKIVP